MISGITFPIWILPPPPPHPDLHGLWDFSSLTRDRTQALGSESAGS